MLFLRKTNKSETVSPSPETVSDATGPGLAGPMASHALRPGQAMGGLWELRAVVGVRGSGDIWLAPFAHGNLTRSRAQNACFS